MSWRIEQTDALKLLRELPDRWAQTCVAHPPRDDERVLAILAEVRRVLRDDGTLWVLLTAKQLPLADELREEGWTQQPTPEWASSPSAYTPGKGARLLLFTKGRRYFYDRDTITAWPGSRRALSAGTSRQARLAQTCLHAREHERRLTLVKRCIRAGSSLTACEECGAPYRRARPGERGSGLRRPTCSHNSPGGCCLVLDPFYDRAGLPTVDAALCVGRSFLGITEPSDPTCNDRGGEHQ